MRMTFILSSFALFVSAGSFTSVAMALETECFAKVSSKCEKGFVVMKDLKPASVNKRAAQCRVARKNYADWFHTLGACNGERKPTTTAGACYYWAPQEKGPEVCAVGTLDVSNKDICVAGGVSISEFYLDSKCKKYIDPRACWVWSLDEKTEEGNLKCDLTAGKIVPLKNSNVSGKCLVGSREEPVEYFYDNHCQKAAFLAAKNTNAIPDTKIADQMRIKNLPETTTCAAEQVYDAQTGKCVGYETGIPAQAVTAD